MHACPCMSMHVHACPCMYDHCYYFWSLCIGIPLSNLLSFGIGAGDLLGPSNDDSSSDPLTLRIPFTFFGTQYRKIIVRKCIIMHAYSHAAMSLICHEYRWTLMVCCHLVALALLSMYQGSFHFFLLLSLPHSGMTLIPVLEEISSIVKLMTLLNYNLFIQCCQTLMLKV